MSHNLEEILDQLISKNNPERKIFDKPGDSFWGQLILPEKINNKHVSEKLLRILLIASYKTGGILLKTLIEIQKLYPSKLEIVGLITDDPVSDDAKISVKKRIWRKYDKTQILSIEDDIIEMALNNGIPCYTGDIKTNFGHHLVKKLNPDAIMVCVFGQIIDKPIINDPVYGIYNFHPADLKHHHGAGPQPYQDLLNRNAKTTKFTIHKLTEQLDAGHIVGQSPNICVTFSDGKLPGNVLVIEDKIFHVIDYMAVALTYFLLEYKIKNKLKPINSINFNFYFTDKQKNDLLLPITKTTPDNFIRNITDNAKMLIKKLFKDEYSV